MLNDPEHPFDRGRGGASTMTRGVAERILRRHGLDAGGLAPEELKRRWQELARRHHPDLGGDMEAMQEINAAYTFLKPHAASAEKDAGAAPARRDTSSPRFNGAPVWAWAGAAEGALPDEVISRDDYSDLNYLKKRLWELSGHSTQAWTLWAFNGEEFLLPVVAYASAAIFPEMARAMLRHARRGFRTPRAVFAQAPNERYELLLLNSDGRAHEPPLPFAHSSAGGLTRDRAFVLGLPNRLDALSGKGPSRF